MATLPNDQSGDGRHKCAACAYEQGYADGLKRKRNIDINAILRDLPYSQAQTQRHESVHLAYALGYYEGVKASY
jgi:hypothetical protein